MKPLVTILVLVCCLSPSLLHSSSMNDSTQALDKIEIVQSRHGRFLVFPYVFYTPETALAFGIGGIVTFYTSEYLGLRPSKLSLSGYYSTNKQYKFTLTPQVYLMRNQLFLSMDWVYGHFLEKFYGIGNSTPENGTEEYTADSWGLMVSIQLPPLFISKNPNTKIGLLFDYVNYQIDDVKDNPYLPDPELPGSGGGHHNGIGISWGLDNRDNIFYPTHGMFHQFMALFYLKELGSQDVFQRFKLDLRQYLQIVPSHILAMQALLNVTDNTVPFYVLPKLGGQQIMRGYYEGRYRDKNLMAAQLEYRTHLGGKFGFIAFGGVGEVARQFREFTVKGLKPSLGFGIRFLFSEQEKVNLRADVGFGQHTSGIYFGIEEAF